jgi:hypothetical protein
VWYPIWESHKRKTYFIWNYTPPYTVLTSILNITFPANYSVSLDIKDVQCYTTGYDFSPWSNHSRVIFTCIYRLIQKLCNPGLLILPLSGKWSTSLVKVVLYGAELECLLKLSLNPYKWLQCKITFNFEHMPCLRTLHVTLIVLVPGWLPHSTPHRLSSGVTSGVDCCMYNHIPSPCSRLLNA